LEREGERERVRDETRQTDGESGERREKRQTVTRAYIFAYADFYIRTHGERCRRRESFESSCCCGRIYDDDSGGRRLVVVVFAIPG
jgi:hypothetical protein